MQVRTGDQVAVIAGNYKGSEGRVIRVEPGRNRVVVEGINMRTRHQRPSQANPEGGIVTFEAPIHASNVMVICPRCGEGTRPKRSRLAEGRSVRRCGKCNEIIGKA